MSFLTRLFSAPSSAPSLGWREVFEVSESFALQDVEAIHTALNALEASKTGQTCLHKLHQQRGGQRLQLVPSPTAIAVQPALEEGLIGLNLAYKAAIFKQGVVRFLSLEETLLDELKAL